MSETALNRHRYRVQSFRPQTTHHRIRSRDYNTHSVILGFTKHYMIMFAAPPLSNFALSFAARRKTPSISSKFRRNPKQSPRLDGIATSRIIFFVLPNNSSNDVPTAWVWYKNKGGTFITSVNKLRTREPTRGFVSREKPSRTPQPFYTTESKN